jgi:hypothetical protein
MIFLKPQADSWEFLQHHLSDHAILNYYRPNFMNIEGMLASLRQMHLTSLDPAMRATRGDQIFVATPDSKLYLTMDVDLANDTVRMRLHYLLYLPLLTF